MFDQVGGVTYNIYGMKNRVLLIMLIVFIVLAGICITCGTIFVVRDIEVVDGTVQTAEALTEAEKNDIITKSGLRGKSILFNIHQDQIAKKIKSVDTMLKLQTVTAKFPNRVVLVVSRRVPLFCDSDNNLWFDAEMCRVKETAPDPVNITGANLLLNELEFGDLAIGKDQWTQHKIKQIKIVGNYFSTLHGFEIAYDDSTQATGNRKHLCLLLKIKSGVTYKIKIKPEDDFLHALEFTDQIYQEKNVNGVYETMYRDHDSPGKVGMCICDNDGTIKKDQAGKEMIYYEK